MQKLITIKAAKLTPLQKIVVLVFDAIHLKKKYAYCNSEDRIYGDFGSANSPNTLLMRAVFAAFVVQRVLMKRHRRPFYAINRAFSKNHFSELCG